MPRRSLFAIVSLALLSSVAAPAAPYVDLDGLRQAGMTQYWQLKLPLAEGQELADVYLVEDHLYACTVDGFVFSLDARTGTVLWLKRVTTGGYRIEAPCHAGDRVIFVTPAEMRQYDRHYGDAIRSLKFEFPAGSPAVSDGSRYIVGGIDQRFYAFRVDWNNARDNEFGDFPVWKVATRGQVVSRPVLFGDYVAVASDDGRIYACRSADKGGMWITGLGTSVTADLAADDKGVYVACRDQSLYMLEPNTGKQIWRERLGAPLAEPPVLTADRAYQFTESDGVVSIASATQFDGDRTQWKLGQGRRLLTVVADHGLMLARNGGLLDVRLSDGSVRGTVATDLSLAISVPERPWLYLASPDGRIFCGRVIGTPTLQASEVRAAQVPGGGAEVAVATSQPTTEEAATSQPAASPTATFTGKSGPTIGGKSKVSRDYTGG